MSRGDQTVLDYEQYWAYLISRSRLGGIYRKYWLYPKLAKHLVGRALDIGCGIGDMLRFRAKTVGVDVNEKAVDYCKSLGLDVHLMRPDELPFPSESFDSALLDNVLEHVEEPAFLLEEVCRVMKFGGCLLVGVPGILGWKIDDDHKVFYDETSLVKCVEAYRFIHVKTFYQPLWKSDWLSRSLRQYCVYAVFRRV